MDMDSTYPMFLIPEQIVPVRPKPKLIHSCASHLTDAIIRENIDRAVQKAAKVLHDVKFDTIAFRGMSGALFAPVLAHVMDKELLMIRRNDGNDGSASGMPIEGNVSAKRYVIVDDFVCTTSTCVQIVRALNTLVSQAKLVGMYFYNEFENSREDYNYDRGIFYAPQSERVKHIISRVEDQSWNPIR